MRDTPTLTHEKQELLEVPHSSPLEFAEKYAAAVFQHDDAGRELLRQDLLTGLRGEEKATLTEKLNQSDTRHLLETIKIYEGKHVVVSPDEPYSHFLLTNELNGCTATAVVSENNEGAREAVLTHFPDFMGTRQATTLKDVLTDSMKSSTKKSALIYAAEGRLQAVPEIERQLKSLLGEETKVQVVPYKKSKREDYGVLLIRIPPVNKGDASAHASDMNVML